MKTMKTKSAELGAKPPKKALKSESTATKKNSAASQTISDRVLKFVKAIEDPPLKDRYDALMGIGGPVEEALSSYSALLKQSAKEALASIENSMVKEGADLKLQVSRVAVQPTSDLDFPVLEARKAIAKYGKAGYDGIGAVRLCPVPDPETGVTMIAMDAVTLYTGSPPASRPVRRRRRASFGDGLEHAASITFNLSDRTTVKAALASLFYPPLTRLPIGDPFENEDQPFAKGSKQAERAFVTLMARSQLPAKKMLMGFGAGKSVMDGALGRLDYLVKEQCKGKSAVVHRDLVPHFWFSELRRLELHHLMVPTIRLR